jgi:hypothetical protein
MRNFINIFFKSDTYSTVQEVHCFYWNPESLLPLSKSYPLGSTLGLMNLYLNIEFFSNNIFLNTPRSHKWSNRFKLSGDNVLRISNLIYTCYMSRPSRDIWYNYSNNGKNYPCNSPWRSIGLWDVEATTFSRKSVHRWQWGCQPYAPAALYPQEDSCYSFVLQAESTAGAQCGWKD